MIKIHQEIYGHGQPLVLIHGWAMHTGIWREFAKKLAVNYQVICLDLPGHGLSDDIGPYTLDHISSTLIEQLPQSFSLLGWSLGGSVALTLARNYPDRVNSIILMAGNPRFVKDGDWIGVRAELLQDFAKNLSINCKSTLVRFLTLQVFGLANGKQILLELKKAIDECDEPKEEVLQRGLDILMQADLRADLSTAKSPICIIQGNKDTLVPAKVAQQIQQIQPACEINVIEGAGHVPFLSHQSQVILAINHFL